MGPTQRRPWRDCQNRRKCQNWQLKTNYLCALSVLCGGRPFACIGGALRTIYN
jgi:hypothetical protein